MHTHVPHITVCVCTFRRPGPLARLLSELSGQETNGQFTFSVVVCDNDASRSANQVVAQIAEKSHLAVAYCAEPEQNIALARNRALANAGGDYIAFIDDDEFPAPCWLLSLFNACHRFGADGVLGPVKPHFEQEPPAWIITGRFFERPGHETGFFIDWTEGRTGNVLLKRSVLDGIGDPFRREFGSGGEDRDFFRRMIAAGKRFVWCDEAVAFETVPPVRWKRSFMLRRALLRGKVALNHRGGKRDLVKSAVAVVAYGLALPLLSIRGQHVLMKYLIKTCDHAGKLLAVVRLNPIREKYVVE